MTNFFLLIIRKNLLLTRLSELVSDTTASLVFTEGNELISGAP